MCLSLAILQTILCGMGELHIEIIHDRIRREYGIETHLGPLQVAYRETILNEVSTTGTHRKTHFFVCTSGFVQRRNDNIIMYSSHKNRYAGPYCRGQTTCCDSGAGRQTCGHRLCRRL